MPIFDKILFLYLPIFVFLFLLNRVVFLLDSSFERGNLRGVRCASWDLKKILKYILQMERFGAHL